MKLQKTLLGLILAASLTTGCSDGTNNQIVNSELAMTFTPTIGSAQKTKATINSLNNMVVRTTIVSNQDTIKNTWKTGDKIAVNVNDSVYSYTINENGKLTSTNPYKINTKAYAQISAWFPYSATSPSAYTVNSDQTGSGYQNSDLLYAKEAMSYGVYNTLTFNHVGAKVVVNVVNTEAATSATDVTAITINGINPHVATTATGCVASYEALCVPATVMSGKNIFTLTVNNHEYSYAPTNLTLEGGKSYTFNITVGKTTTKPSIGDYLFNDGSYGTLAANSSKTPVAIIFSNSPSATDYDNGYTNGYAIALKNANSKAQWYDGTDVSDLTDYTDWTSMKDDKDGYTNTQTIKKNRKITSGGSGSYAAFYYAINYGTELTSNNSNWYLPSIGQWYDICVNLGGMAANPTKTQAGMAEWYKGDDATGNIYSSIALKNINTYLTAAKSKGFNVDLVSDDDEYWSSSEYSSSNAYSVYFSSSSYGNMLLHNMAKGTTLLIRPVIAF